LDDQDMRGDADFYRSSWVEIDLGRFHANISHLRRIAGTKSLLVVKANAYGHGLTRMAREAVAAGVDMLGVATIHEAQQVRSAGVAAPILIMCAMNQAEVEYCVAHGIHFLAWRADQFDGAVKAAERFGTTPRIHLELDTGMSRSGVVPADFEELLNSLAPESRSTILGLATHFHSADEESLDSAEGQLAELLQCVDIAERFGLRPMVHAANSPGTLRLPHSRLAMVRLGIIAYGLPPSDHTPVPDGIEPVLSWKATLTNVKTIEPGRGIGYGWQYIADETMTIGTLAVGYADGFHRVPKGANRVLFEERTTPVLGSVFMDQCVIRIPDGLRPSVGETAVLIGKQSAASMSAEDLAQRWGTNNYDVVAGIRSRVPRVYLG
jgi:alanine racemase